MLMLQSADEDIYYNLMETALNNADGSGEMYMSLLCLLIAYMVVFIEVLPHVFHGLNLGKW
jgi:hypothetical protein